MTGRAYGMALDASRSIDTAIAEAEKAWNAKLPPNDEYPFNQSERAWMEKWPKGRREHFEEAARRFVLEDYDDVDRARR
jgi:hypothetical protein